MLRCLTVFAATIVLSGCATYDALNVNSTAEVVAIADRDAPLEQRHAAAREAQLQTPLVLPPEATGAPPAARRGAPNLTGSDLVGLDTGPDLRVWTRSGRLYGPSIGARAVEYRPVVVTPPPAVKPGTVAGEYVLP